jgi:hypothetical protein
MKRPFGYVASIIQSQISSRYTSLTIPRKVGIVSLNKYIYQVHLSSKFPRQLVTSQSFAEWETFKSIRQAQGSDKN